MKYSRPERADGACRLLACAHAHACMYNSSARSAAGGAISPEHCTVLRAQEASAAVQAGHAYVSELPMVRQPRGQPT